MDKNRPDRASTIIGSRVPFSNDPKLHDAIGNRKKSEKALSKSAFKSAEEFMTGVFIMDETMFMSGKLVPIYVNCAFACELFLKSLLYHYNIDPGKKHNLDYLFGLLPERIKNDLREKVVRLSPSECLDKLLKEVGDAFIFARYSHERNGLLLNYAGLFEITKLIHSIAQKEIAK